MGLTLTRPSLAAIREGVLRCVGNCPRASGCDYCAQRAQLLGWRDHMLDLMRRDLQAEAEAEAKADGAEAEAAAEAEAGAEAEKLTLTAA